jgi:hypothetical protein
LSVAGAGAGAACKSNNITSSTDNYITTVLGPGGGMAQGPMGSNITVNVPQGALAQSVMISIGVLDPSAAPAPPAGYAYGGPVYSFEPHGIGFAMPVTVNFAGATSTNTFHAVCPSSTPHGTSGGCAWDRSPVAGIMNGSFNVNAFSLYALVERADGGSGGVDAGGRDAGGGCTQPTDCAAGQACNTMTGRCEAACGDSSHTACNGGCCDGAQSVCTAGGANNDCGANGGACTGCSGGTPTCGGGSCNSTCGGAGNGTCGAGFYCATGNCAACGASGQTCCPGSVCNGAGLTCSGNMCVACGAKGQACCNGTCGGAPLVCCGGDGGPTLCADTSGDVNHCGGCNNVCSGLNAQGTRCVTGACVETGCNVGYGDCNADPSNLDGCETQTNTDFSHCGSCGNACLPSTANSCAGGMCLCYGSPFCTGGKTCTTSGCM